MSAIEQILYWASVNYHPLYEQYILEEYEGKNGPHFDREHAEKVVVCMYHIGEDGRKVTGEAWSVDDARQAAGPYWSEMEKGTTDYDVYVALNMWQHDLGCNYVNRSKDELVEDALTWAFMDDDAEEGKLWRYMWSQKG